MIHVTCRLTASNRDQLRNPTLGRLDYRVWATFTFFSILQGIFQSCARSAPLEGSVRRPPRIKAQPSTDQIVTTQYSKGTVHTVTFPILLLLLLLLLLSSLSFYPLA